LIEMVRRGMAKTKDGQDIRMIELVQKGRGRQ
jgi:hypothetical protein